MRLTRSVPLWTKHPDEGRLIIHKEIRRESLGCEECCEVGKPCRCDGE